MNNKKDNQYYISKILKDLNFLIVHTKDLMEEEFKQDEVLLDSILFRLIQIAESIRNLSNEFRDRNPQIPWVDITGFRNRIVHEYGEVDLSIVFHIIKIDIYELIKLFDSL